MHVGCLGSWQYPLTGMRAEQYCEGLVVRSLYSNLGNSKVASPIAGMAVVPLPSRKTHGSSSDGMGLLTWLERARAGQSEATDAVIKSFRTENLGWARLRLEDKRRREEGRGGDPLRCTLQVLDVPVETQGNPEPGGREVFLPPALGN